MSEHDFSASGQPDPAAGFQPTAGALLREARQAQGVHLAALAASLKVPVEKLEALEQDRFDLLLDAAFVRALASGVCRLLKLDPNPILQRLPALNATKVTTQNRGINETFRSHGEPGSSLSSQFSKPVIVGAVALLLGAVVLIFLPNIQKQMGGSFSGQDASSPAKPASEPSSGAESATVQEPVQNAVPPASSPADESRLPTAPEVVPSQPAAPAASAPVASSSVPAATASAPALTLNKASAASSAGINPSSVMTFSAKEASWVKVTDGKGVVVLQRLLQAGETTGVSGALPLRVLIGRADAVQVQVRGQEFDLKAHTVAKNNVARFEVK